MQIIRLKGAANIRDFGGTKTMDGRTVKSGMFIRGSALDKLTDSDLKFLEKTCRVRTVIDLRTPPELEERPDKRIPGAVYHHFSLLDESLYGISHEKAFDDPDIVRKVPDMKKLYADISNTEFAVNSLKQAFDVILSPVDGAVYWHCKEGKDRCGIVSALFLTLLGVDPADIVRDYLKTNRVARKKAVLAFVGSLIRFKSFSDAQKIYGIFLAKESFLFASLNAFREKYGSMEAFFKERLGISDEQIEALKNRCLE